LKENLAADFTALKAARDELLATIASFPFNKISNSVVASVLQSIYTGFASLANNGIDFAHSTNFYSNEQGAVKAYDSPTKPGVSLFNTYCGHFSTLVRHSEDGFKSDPECAVREYDNAKGLAFYQGYADNIGEAEEETKKNITAAALTYKTTIEVARTFLVDENTRLKKCTVNTSTCADALVRSKVFFRLKTSSCFHHHIAEVTDSSQNRLHQGCR
jgi:hypothetical protein